MSIAGIILLLFIALILYILIIPVSLKIDTYENNHYFRMPGICGVRVQKNNGVWKAWFSVLFLTFNIQSLKGFTTAKNKSHKAEDKFKRKKRYSVKRLKMFLKVLKTLRIKKLQCEIDTGDFPLNAQLIPIAYALSRKNIDLAVNFRGSNDLYLIVYTRIYRIIYQIITN